MAIRINFDSNHNVQTPTFVLTNRNGDRLGVIPAYNIVFKDTMNSYSELTFKVDKVNNRKEYPLWDKLKDFKLVWCKEWNIFFELEVELEESNGLTKNIIAKSLGESELSQINLYDIEINTDEDIQNFIKINPNVDYIPTILYDEKNHKRSLLHRILEKAPHYSIKYVSSSLQNIQRTFSFDGTSIIDALYEIAEELDAIVIINSGLNDDGTIERSISFYDLENYCVDCGKRGNFEHECSECHSTNIEPGYGNDTTIFVSTDNLADNINYSTDVDSVKNCFRLVAGDDLMTATLVNCNPNGTGYLWYISDDIKEDMSAELVAKLEEYDANYNYYQNDYNANIGSSYIDDYNTLIAKYANYIDEDDENKPQSINNSIIGYPQLMQSYYSTIDFYLYLQDKLMPETGTLTDTTSQEQASKLTNANLSPVAVTKLSSCSAVTAKNAVLGMAKVLIDKRYRVEVNDGYTLNGNIWEGSFTLTNYSNDEDTYITNKISVTVNEDYETFVKQKIDKTLNSDVKDITNIVNIFKLDGVNFENELKKYCLKSLESFYDGCQACINILIEQGVSDGITWGDTYNSLYIPFLDKSNAIQDEIKLREKELAIIKELEIQIETERNYIQDNLKFQEFIGDELWLEFSAYRREDTYTNNNYISDGSDNAKLFKDALEFIETAKKEIYKSATLQHSISATLKNLLIMKEFMPIVDYFEIGNWIRVRVDDKIYKLRLLDYQIDFESLNNISITFSDVKKVVDGYSDIESIINSAVSMSSSYDSVSRQAGNGQKSNQQLQTWFNDGLSLTNMKIIGNVDNQDQTWDSHGMLFRKYNSETDDYDDTQMKIINSTIALTTDNWETTKSAMGKFVYRDMTDGGTIKYGYGINAEVLCGKLILGETLGIYNNTNSEVNSMTFDNNGLIVKGNHNTVKINANPTSSEYNGSIFTIIKNGANTTPDKALISFDENGYGIIGGWNITENEISKSDILPNGIPYRVFMNSVPYDSSQGEPHNPMFGVMYNNDWRFYVRSNGHLYAKDAEIMGRITASSGRIGCWNIGNIENGQLVEGRLFDISDNRGWTGVNKYGLGAAFYAGGNDVTGNNSPFRVYHDGSLIATNANITGTIAATSGSIAGWNINKYGISKTDYWYKGDTEKDGDANYRTVMQSFSYDEENHSFANLHRYPVLCTMRQDIVNEQWVDNYLTWYIKANGEARFAADAYGNYIVMRQAGEVGVAIQPCDNYYYDGTQMEVSRGRIGGKLTLWQRGWFDELHCKSLDNSSDIKIKNHINYLDDDKNIENFIMSLKPVSYTLKNGTGHRRHLGLYAQEVAEAAKSTVGDLSLFKAEKINAIELPNVDGDSVCDEEYIYYSEDIPDEELSWTLNYIELIAPMITVIQKQQKQLEDFSQRIDKLTEIINSNNSI